MTTARLLSTCLVGLTVGSGAFAAGPEGPTLDGVSIGVDAEVEAGDRSRELALPDGVRITLHPGAIAKLYAPVWFPAEHGTKSSRGYRLGVRQGDVTLHVPADPAERIGLSTTTRGGDTVIVWHGTVRVSVAPTEARAVVLDGASFIGSHGKWLPARGPIGVVLRAGADAEMKHALPASPAWADARPAIVLLRGDAPVSTSLEWTDVPHAAGYRVDVSDEAQQHTVMTWTTEGSVHAAPLPALASGAYFVRVTAIGADAFFGKPSPARALRIARVSLPAGAITAPDGAIVLREGTGLTLDTPAGLEMSGAGAGDLATATALATTLSTFTPARAELGLVGQRASVLRLRDAATRAEARLVLVRRDLRARVELTPRLARWPKDPVDVRVTLADPSGRFDPTKENVAIEARVNGGVVALAWRQAHGAQVATWVTRIQPQATPGPWLIDVVVRDASGATLGESMLDVDGPARADLGRTARAP